MIALLTGQIACKSIDHVIVDVGGVGYRLTIPLSTFYALPEAGAVRLHVHTHVREDAIHLFGFLKAEEKEMFTTLLAVSGIGPKVAVNILSHIPAGDLAAALADADIKRLSAMPGIGKKTAERLVLELKDKVRRLGLMPAAPDPAVKPSPSGTSLDDALSALVNLGYRENLARKALETMEIQPGAPLEEILKGALKVLLR